jgi:uncharacterized protein YaiE (UPF0345 family)
MLQAGTNVSTKGRALKSTDNKEIQYLFDILQALKNMTGALAPGTVPAQYSLAPSATLTLAASTYKSISFQVITGTLTVSMDGGSTTVAYSAGANINVQGNLITPSFTFSMSGGGSDQAFVQTVAP